MKELLILQPEKVDTSSLREELGNILSADGVIIMVEDGIYNSRREKILCCNYMEDFKTCQHGSIQKDENWRYLDGFTCPMCDNRVKRIYIVMSDWERAFLTLPTGEICIEHCDYDLYEYYCPECDGMLPYDLVAFLES